MDYFQYSNQGHSKPMTVHICVATIPWISFSIRTKDIPNPRLCTSVWPPSHGLVSVFEPRPFQTQDCEHLFSHHPMAYFQSSNQGHSKPMTVHICVATIPWISFSIQTKDIPNPRLCTPVWPPSHGLVLVFEPRPFQTQDCAYLCGHHPMD
ncbi:hypothetical protein RRG08_051548 [Elysia crispata]|uniref:Uncharacterized protein n=1 Tax=Elysia crispata TaxID=231223 RepID=A0AAE0Y0T0_9GAST|nr:hypothetical protein RRG08_051548 [Elysia crispata]